MTAQVYSLSVQALDFFFKYRLAITITVITLMFIAMLIIPGVAEAGPAPSGSTCGSC